MWTIHPVYPRVMWIHLALNQCLQRWVCTVPSSFSQFTALPFVVCFINARHKGNSNCFSNTSEETAAIAFQGRQSLVPPTKPALRLPEGRSSCVSVQGSGWPSLPEHFCCGSLQTPRILVFIASRQAHTRGSHSTAW